MSTFCLATPPLLASTQPQKFSYTLFPCAFLCCWSPVDTWSYLKKFLLYSKFVLRQICMYPNALWFASYSKDFVKSFLLLFSLWVSCFLQRRQSISLFSLKTSHHVPVSLLYASGLLSVECWNLEILLVVDLTGYTTWQLGFIPQWLCWCRWSPGSNLRKITFSLSVKDTSQKAHFYSIDYWLV